MKLKLIYAEGLELYFKVLGGAMKLNTITILKGVMSESFFGLHIFHLTIEIFFQIVVMRED
ncbi:hypothetical protein BBI09_00570 [Stutzerimonas xanthomarina]|nr:hypothetical protein BBI09_00570 [Stutzerimonas xanthomarina]